ncbi:IclR family transcriptional regulator [Rhodococcoides fascians A25f]|uniref:IclR family transcriptional regulator n=1 Tax=Rhodococcoides fascians TaxID=1828 RepID=UPI0009B8A248|nr:IclR family transcriptional regulator [Rhodococcus fascians]QII07303.1 IclR family transcriptional regulator [Rhodococcus fascians A25f]
MSDAPSSMVERVVLILDVFARSSGTLTLGQISSRSRLPRSSVHRILQQLVTARWIDRRDNEYTLGLRMFEIGSQVEQRTRFSEISRPLMQELSTATGHVVHLALLDEHDVVYLEKVGGPFGGRLPSRVGGRLPAHCTGVGKVLLAYSPDPIVEEYKKSGMRRQTNASIMSEEALESSIRSIRNFGYSTERGEAVPGVACVGAPIFEFGNVVAAISACGPQQRLRVDELKHRIMWTAAEISRRLMASSCPPSRTANQLPFTAQNATVVDFQQPVGWHHTTASEGPTRRERVEKC